MLFFTMMLKINFPCGNIVPKYFHLEASVLAFVLFFAFFLLLLLLFFYFFYHNNSQ